MAEMLWQSVHEYLLYIIIIYIYVTIYMKTRPVAQKKFLSYGYSLVEETFFFLKRSLI